VSTHQRVLVVDIGTSSIRAAVVRDDATFAHEAAYELLPETPADGIVEFDAAAMARVTVEAARAALDAAGPVDAVGISNQRASTIVWERATGAPVGPGIGWQDLRTVGECLSLRAEGVRVAPNQSATKIAWMLDHLDEGRELDLCAGTVDTWIAWVLSGGALHVTDASNAAVTGLFRFGADQAWDRALLERLRIPDRLLPRVVDSSAIVGTATALPGAPPIAALLGDQQASLIGQGCVRTGDAKITLGTGAMLDLTLGPRPPAFTERGPHGTFPIIAWQRDGAAIYGIEAIVLAAGTNVQWLRDDLGLIASSDASHELAATVPDTEGVVFVPALLGLGTPVWDYGARAAFFGITRGTTRGHIVRAVLEGIAHRCADLVDAAEADAGIAIPVLRVDGGMTENPTFVQMLADTTRRPVEISPVREATTLGAALLAGLAVGHHRGIDDLARTWMPQARVEPASELDRERWQGAVERARRWIPALSGIDF
jgi:glycerol kinase